MPKKGIAFKCVFSAFNMNSKTRQVDDSANMTVRVSKDGAAATTATNTATELLDGATKLGRYVVQITASEAACNTLAVLPNSATANILCEDAEYQMDDPTGTRTITITITDDATALPIPGVTVEAWNVAENVIYTAQTADSAGQVALVLWDGSYHIKLAYRGYDFGDPKALTVTANASVAYTGSDVSGGAPAAGIQRVYGYITRTDGDSADGATVEVRLNGIPQAISGQLLSSQVLSDTVSSSYFELQIVKGAKVEVVAKTSEGVVFLRKSFTVSNEDAEDFTNY